MVLNPLFTDCLTQHLYPYLGRTNEQQHRIGHSPDDRVSDRSRGRGSAAAVFWQDIRTMSFGGLLMRSLSRWWRRR
jgi:hypothetical protein